MSAIAETVFPDFSLTSENTVGATCTCFAALRPSVSSTLSHCLRPRRETSRVFQYLDGHLRGPLSTQIRSTAIVGIAMTVRRDKNKRQMQPSTCFIRSSRDALF